MAFKICKKGDCGITVTDLNEYLDSSVLNIAGNIYYTFEESSSVNAIISISYDNTRTLVASDITKHEISTDDQTGETTNVTDESELTFGNDGLYEVVHLVLPNQKYIEKYSSQLPSTFPNGVYYINDETKKIYKYGSTEEVDVALLVELNETGTTINKEMKNTFSLCRLQDCFYKLCKDLLNNLCGKSKCTATDKYSQEILNRDIIWMALNVIKYAIEQGQYLEAQRILENITGCGNICGKFETNNLNSSGCGCNH